MQEAANKKHTESLEVRYQMHPHWKKWNQMQPHLLKNFIHKKKFINDQNCKKLQTKKHRVLRSVVSDATSLEKMESDATSFTQKILFIKKKFIIARNCKQKTHRVLRSVVSDATSLEKMESDATSFTQNILFIKKKFITIKIARSCKQKTHRVLRSVVSDATSLKKMESDATSFTQKILFIKKNS